jgi:hypothetical protein
MKENLENFIQLLQEQLPEVCTSNDLLKFQIFQSQSELSQARSKGLTPNFFKYPNGRVKYLKSDVLAWIKGLYRENKK